ncbi:DNA replication licensing factor REC [Drosophila obscura]|uniref:DNA replication licensing factor REC n=1 Tax=Drosophila obscura TaxID=7282 RepID=UPI001BB15919|nr:DNA replication licensing factor REC [Drosophila obscura]
MNSPAHRGRGRGGGGYRPYFYFRRKGRVIPAGGKRQQGQEAGTSADAAESRPPPARGWNRPASKRGRDANIDCSFLRPENYAAPEDGLQVQSIAVDNPKACPGWRLYFLRDTYTEDSDLAKRIMAVEAHYQRNPQKYDFVRIREQGFFKLPALGIVHDEQLKKAWPQLTEDLRDHPLRTLSTLAVAMHTVVINHNLDTIDTSATCFASTLEQYVPPPGRIRKIYVRPEDFTPVELTTGISHDRVDTLFSVRGIVSSVGEPTYSIAWQSFRCSRCQAEQAMRQRGTFQPRPYHCKQAQCVAKDSFVPLRSSPYTRISAKQIVRLEESSLSLIADYDSILPGEMDVELRHDLVDCVHVGQEIVVNGVLKLRDLCEDMTTGTGAGTSNEMKAYLKAASIQDARHKKREFSERDLEAIAMVNADPNSFKLLVQSLAPEVHGHELPKAACLLSLLGGTNGGVNVLLVGDPGIGKSKILQNCAQITERGSHISGKRGAQSAQRLGPTFTGRNKRVLQAGALMTASSLGHCTLDDVDKLASKQAVLLQCMQSGEINMPLPGAFSTFLARPSIIASANPQRGQYDEGRYLLQNIHIVPSLLKEFHLVYVLLDKPSAERDISLTAHVRALHAGAKKRAQIAARYALKPKTSHSMCEGTFYEARADDDADNDSIMEQDYDLDKRLELLGEDAELDLLPPILIKKFLAYARQNVHPLLSDAASRSIERFFMELREGGRTGGEAAYAEQSQIGSGQLLGLIHLSEARARLDLSNVVTPQHVRDVIALLTESITQTSLKAEGCGGRGRRSSKVPAAGGGGRASQLRNFVHMMQLRAVALGRRIFEFEELKEIGTRAGVLTGISQLVEIANMGGHLLKKGANMYEVVPD